MEKLEVTLVIVLGLMYGALNAYHGKVIHFFIHTRRFLAGRDSVGTTRHGDFVTQILVVPS
jgi:hypothetical protein